MGHFAHCAKVCFIHRDFFNWTWTYKKDSDIIEHFGFSYKNIEDLDIDVKPKKTINYTSKTNLAFWIADECYSNSESYIKELKRYIDIDDFGKCFHKTSTCHDAAQKYFFVLAFENNNCSGYVSKYFWQALELPLVPVVLGGSDYKEMAPKQSFINIRDFKDLQHVANHMKSAAKDKVLQ